VTYLPPAPTPCEKNPCGQNAICKERNGVGSCICQENYYGDPYVACKPECVTNSDCSLDKACNSNMRCYNPCSVHDICGLGAQCKVVRHNPVCVCQPGLTGDPFIKCSVERSKKKFKSTKFIG
jgi:hypothetical protein